MAFAVDELNYTIKAVTFPEILTSVAAKISKYSNP